MHDIVWAGINDIENKPKRCLAKNLPKLGCFVSKSILKGKLEYLLSVWRIDKGQNALEIKEVEECLTMTISNIL